MELRKIIATTIREYLNEQQQEVGNYYTLYHGTSSGKLDFIKLKPNKLFLTTDEDVATYYAAKGY